MKFADLLKKYELSQSEFSRKYEIPLRTVQHWANGDRLPPEWLLPVLEKAILYDQEEE